ncbi:MAG: MFS transporter [Gulosibacter sp.]|uniref:MFS transporter n=1 Tax=Gulosibacter sp. TaxID=2817531 RepID=UPI003F922F26
MNPNRIPLRIGSGGATFMLAIVGLLTANLSPFMMEALETSLGITPVDSGNILTGCLLVTAISCILITRIAEGPHRRLVARIGLAIATFGFGLVALTSGQLWFAVIGLLLGGLGTGAAIASGGAALAAFENPNRVSGLSGLTNRSIIGVVMLVIPVFEISVFSVFTALTAFSLVALILTSWLPKAPLSEVETVAVTVPEEDAASSISPRTVTIAGFAVLIFFALWAIGEDSIWVMGIEIGTVQAGLTADEAGFALGASTISGLVVAAVFAALGNRIGRVVPLIIVLLCGAALKMLLATTTDPTVFLWAFIGWNAIYTAGFMYFIAIAAALDPKGKWSGPIMGVYLVGSSFAPMIGAWVIQEFGFTALGIFTAAISLVLVVPMAFAARVSMRVEREQAALTSAAKGLNVLRTTAY